MNILVIGAHPDDESLGLGGTINHFIKKGHSFSYFLADHGRSDTLDERFDSKPILDWIKLIEEKIAQVKPRIVFTHYLYDLNRDHQIIAEATQVACRPQSGVEELYSFEIYGSTDYGTETFRPDTYISLTEEDISAKILAMRNQYPAELLEIPHPRSEGGIRTLARYRGMQIHQSYAEAFVTVRRIIK